MPSPAPDRFMPHPILLPRTDPALLWFDAVPSNEHLISQYQMYAVEKWLVDRSRTVHVLLVFTGDPHHRITLSQYTPKTPHDYDKAVHLLRRDGARPKQTEHGVLMVTSLAHFRSDFTIVKIPEGDFGAVKDQLYANINLLRMGCSGRSALSLDEASDSTKDRFLSAYQLQLPHTKAKDRVVFTNTVLELVKLIQAGLSLFACYGSLLPPSPSVILDGLLCDDTVEGIHKWISEIGEPCLGLEPTERVADPSFVSALLSTVLCARNKLHALVTSSASSSSTQVTPVPKDPFVYPYAFSLALSSYLQLCSTQASQSPSPNVFLTTQTPPFMVTGIFPAVQPSVPPTRPPAGAVLTQEVLEYIDACYDKSKSADNRVRRVFKGKRDDLTRGFAVDSDGDDNRGALSETEASPHHHHHHLNLTPSNSVGASSGNRVLGGITTLLSNQSSTGGAGSITEPQTSLASFLSTALSKESGTANAGGRIRRIRDSVGGAGAGDHSVRTAVGKGVSKAIGKTKRQRHESVDMGSFYSGGPLAAAGIIPITGHPVSAASPPPAEGSSTGGQAGGGAVEKEWAEKDVMKEKEVVVGGSVKALWGGRVGDLVKMREWCDDVARTYHLESSALILPSSSYQPGAGGGQRVPSGSTVGSHNSGSHLKDKGKRKEKFTDRLEREKERAKEKLKLSPSALLGIQSDTDQAKSDTGRSTEGEESEPVYAYASPSRSSRRPALRPHSISASNIHSHPSRQGLPQPPDMVSSNPMASASFGSLLGGRVRGKLGNWAGGLTKRKGGSQSVDLGGTPVTSPPMSGHAVTGSVSVASSTKASPIVTRSGMHGGEELLDDAPSLGTRPPAQQRGWSAPILNAPSGKLGNLSISVSPSGNNPLSMSQNSNMSTLSGMSPPMTATASRMTADSQPQSPTLPPMNYGCEAKSGGEEEDVYDVDVLSSGQISPLSDHRSSAFISSRSRPPLSRHFSLAPSSSHQASQLGQDRNYLSVAIVNEKLSRLSADQRAGDSSARSSRTNLNAPFYPSRKKLSLYSANPNASNVHTGEEDEGIAGVGAGVRQGLQAPPRRPKLGYNGRSSSTAIPRISSWSDPLSAALMRGASGHVTPLEHIEPLDLSGRIDFDNAEHVSAPRSSSFATRDRGSSISVPAPNPSSLGGELSEGEAFSDSYVSKPPSLGPRPSVRVRRKTEQNAVAQVGQGSGSWTRDDDGGVKRERARFHSLMSVVDRDGNYFIEEPDALYAHSGEPDGEDGEYGIGYGYDVPGGGGLGGMEDDADDDVLVEGGVDLDDAGWVHRRRRRRGAAKNVGWWVDLRRRRSFSDLDDWRGMDVLSPERMRVDVELCGQVLVMIRREEHLRNVIGCLEILNSSLSQTNTLLRQEYDSHLPALAQLSHRTKVLADLDLQSTRTDNFSQQTNVLRYEAEQFNVPSLYHAASLPRQKVLELRHKVFGVHGVFQEPAPGGEGAALTGDKGKQKMSLHKKSGTGSGRILPEGVRGAHGKFNRLQKRLDGTEVVVDWLGRTESEVEEEERSGRSGVEANDVLRMHGRVEGLLDMELDAYEEDERRRAMFNEVDGVRVGDAVKERRGEEPDVEVVEHSSIRPMWLLRFFMGWGARWSARAAPVGVPTGSNELGVSPERQESEGSIEESRKDR